ncbi:MAG: hypothetical protein H6568_08185 [Lewinellaceae bacterium]|nr:hypothetical protein [Saprospiraceae bacterium]MCB9312733.1 hypothetical protein [Lewinellaceae bacterium]
MTDKGTSKKVTRVGGDEATTSSGSTGFVASAESKGKARNLRIISILSWIVAIGIEVWAILMLRKPPVEMGWLIGLIIGALIFAVIGNVLWKKANRLDPASEKDKTRFFIQNQLGMIISIIAFLPLVILIFTNKDLSGKQKGIVGSIAAIALIIAGVTGVDFDPPSIEQYTEQTAQVEALTGGVNHVYWTKSGKSYHLYSDCSYINSDRTTEIFEGTVAQARELKNITDLCDRCERRAVKENEATVPEAIEEAPVETME